MFGNSFFRPFDEDPFFSSQMQAHNQHMRQMDQMMRNSMLSADPFFGGHPQQQQQQQRQSIQDRPDRNRNHQQNAMMPFGGNLFGGFQDMFGNTRNMMQRFENIQNDPNCHSFSSSTVMSYSNTGDGQPKMYQASTSTRQAPGGVRETRKQVRDSESGVDKMAVGHHIRERGHVIEKSRNQRTGDREESQDFININEEEVNSFDQEWQHATGRYNNQQAALRDRMRRPNHQERRAITDSHHRSQRGYRDRD